MIVTSTGDVDVHYKDVTYNENTSIAIASSDITAKLSTVGIEGKTSGTHTITFKIEEIDGQTINTISKEVSLVFYDAIDFSISNSRTEANPNEKIGQTLNLVNVQSGRNYYLKYESSNLGKCTMTETN